MYMEGTESEEYRQHFLKKLGQSSAAAALIVILGFGAYAYTQTEGGLNIWMVTVAVLIGAIAFVAASSYMDMAGYHYHSCLIGGGLAALAFTGVALALETIAVYLSSTTVSPTVLSYLTLAFAFSLVLSSAAMWVLKGKSEAREAHPY